MTILRAGKVPFSKTGYDVREEYPIYDADSLVADVGGFLGLLLGHSAFSIFLHVSRSLAVRWSDGK